MMYDIDCMINNNYVTEIEKDIINKFICTLNKYDFDCFVECFIKFRKTIQELTVIYNKTEKEILQNIEQIKSRLANYMNKKVKITCDYLFSKERYFKYTERCYWLENERNETLGVQNNTHGNITEKILINKISNKKYDIILELNSVFEVFHNRLTLLENQVYIRKYHQKESITDIANSLNTTNADIERVSAMIKFKFIRILREYIEK